MGQDSGFKSRLVLEICSISSPPVACVHRHVHSSVKSPFIDWFLVLGVEENAGVDVIRKKYHKLALQVHPDKNKHPKAAMAFKLVSEAYACLSDNAKRKAFELERWKNFCFQCNKIPYTSCSSSPGSNANSSSFRSWNPVNWSRYYKYRRSLRDIRERFKEEARVIETCLKAYAVSREESPLYNPNDCLRRSLSHSENRTAKEIPVFNPTDYLFQGYPHLRNQVYTRRERFWYLQTRNQMGGAAYGSPIFEVTSKPTYVRS